MQNVDLQGVRLEICNPEHIRKVREFELSQGYDRDLPHETKRYRITAVAVRTEKKNFDVVAQSKGLAERLAFKKLDRMDFGEYNDEEVDGIEITEIEEVTDAR